MKGCEEDGGCCPHMIKEIVLKQFVTKIFSALLSRQNCNKP